MDGRMHSVDRHSIYSLSSSHLMTFWLLHWHTDSDPYPAARGDDPVKSASTVMRGKLGPLKNTFFVVDLFIESLGPLLQHKLHEGWRPL